MSTLDTLSGTYTIDPAHSRIGFVARHAMVTKVRGSFNEFEGTASAPSGPVRVTIQAASIDTRNAQRDEHLRTGDFLSVEQFPTITFVSTSVQPQGDTLEVTGDLTIKDVTKQVTIPFSFEGTATDPYGNERAGFEGKAEINRQDYGVSFSAPLETGGVLVGDKITLEFEISAIKQA